MVICLRKIVRILVHEIPHVRKNYVKLECGHNKYTDIKRGWENCEFCQKEIGSEPLSENMNRKNCSSN